jgi:hypothetical protein
MPKVSLSPRRSGYGAAAKVVNGSLQQKTNTLLVSFDSATAFVASTTM